MAATPNRFAVRLVDGEAELQFVLDEATRKELAAEGMRAARQAGGLAAVSAGISEASSRRF